MKLWLFCIGIALLATMGCSSPGEVLQDFDGDLNSDRFYG